MKRVPLVNAFSGAAQVVVNITLLLVIVPVFIQKLGLSTYGVYALITAVGSLGVFTNLGFNTSLIKYLAEQRISQESNYDIIVAFIVIGGTTLLVALLTLLFSDFVIFRLLNLLPEMVTPSVRFFYVACIGSYVLQIFSQVPSAILDSQQKIYITNGVQIGVGVFNKLLTLCSLLIVPSLIWIGIIMFVSAFVGLCLLFWFALKVWGKLSCPSLWSHIVPITKKHFVYGRSIYATSIMGFFYEPFTKILISHYVGLTEVGFFDMALKIKSLVLSVMDRILYPILPMFASKQNIDEVNLLQEEVQNKLTIIVIPILLATTFLSKPIVSVWLGITLWPVIISVICIVNCFLLTLLFVPLYHFLTVKGYPHKTFILQSMNVSVNLLLFYCLVPFMGYYGALSAYCLAVLSSIVLAAWYQWSILRSKPIASKYFAVKILKLGICLLIVNGMSTLLIQENWLRIIILTLVNGTVTILLFRWLKLASLSDIERYIGRSNRVGLMLEKLLIQRA